METPTSEPQTFLSAELLIANAVDFFAKLGEEPALLVNDLGEVKAKVTTELSGEPQSSADHLVLWPTETLTDADQLCVVLAAMECAAVVDSGQVLGLMYPWSL